MFKVEVIDENDNIKFYKHMIAIVKEADKENPRIEIIIEEME